MKHQMQTLTDFDPARDNVRGHEVITIRTENSDYEFSVIDARERIGLLSGGVLGAGRFRAVVGPFLRVGINIRFLVRLENSVGSLVTSIVKEVRRGRR